MTRPTLPAFALALTITLRACLLHAEDGAGPGVAPASPHKAYIVADPRLVLTPVPAGEDVIVALPRGAPAPFTGQLFTQETALRWGHYLEQAQERFRVQTELLLTKANAAIEQRERILEAERAARRELTTSAEKKLADAQHRLDHPPFYTTWWFGMVCGVVVTGAISVGVVAAVAN